jgi:hypothetical protein
MIIPKAPSKIWGFFYLSQSDGNMPDRQKMCFLMVFPVFTRCRGIFYYTISNQLRFVHLFHLS